MNSSKKWDVFRLCDPPMDEDDVIWLGNVTADSEGEALEAARRLFDPDGHFYVQEDE